MSFGRGINRGEDTTSASTIAEVVQYAILLEDKEDGDHQSKVTDDIDHKGFLRCGHR